MTVQDQRLPEERAEHQVVEVVCERERETTGSPPPASCAGHQPPRRQWRWSAKESHGNGRDAASPRNPYRKAPSV